MLYALQGRVSEYSSDAIVLECGALSFEVGVPDTTRFLINQTVTVYTYLHWNQESGPQLFGFASAFEKMIFGLILSCSGCGPKIALALLGQLGAQRFLHAIQTGDEAALTKVSGIGAKKAEQMIVHLKHKVAKLAQAGALVGDTGHFSALNTVNDALASLNYSKPEISLALKYVQEQDSFTHMPFDQLMRHALSFLAKRS